MDSIQNKVNKRFFFILSIFLFIFRIGISQTFDNNASAINVQQQILQQAFSATSTYIYGSGDQIKMEVNLWGQVPKPGIYTVPYTTDLITIISMAGGPSGNARLDDIRIISIVKSDSLASPETRIQSVNVEEFLEYGDRSKMPTLKPGDTIFIAGTQWLAIKDILGFIRDVALVANTVFLLIQFSKK